MGKKVKKKARNGHMDKRVSTPSQRTVAEESTPSTETVDDGLSVMKEMKVCSHLDKGIDLNKVSSRIGLIEHIRCEDCREGAVDRRASKGRGKQGKRQGGGSIDTKSESKAIWICLECGHLSCGGVGFPTTPQSHAVRHARQTRHPLAIQFEHLQLRWCFPCNTLIPVERLEENGEQQDLLSDLVKLIKGRSSQGASVDVEDVWFGNGSVASEIKSENTAASILDAKSGYVVKGLANLGNTCFFNSIMQNLLAMDRLRDHFLELDEAVGPLTISLKKLFIETSPASGLNNVIYPRSFLGCVCARAPQFRGYQQHDSHELLRCLLDGLCTEELSARKRTTREIGISTNLGPTFVDAVFGGQLSSTVSCLECGHSSTVFEPFLDLSLPVPTKKRSLAQPTSRAKKSKLPPKRSGRVRPKVNKDADSVASESVPVPSASGASCHLESRVPVNEKVGDGLADSKLVECVGPSTVADKKSSVLSNLSTAEEFTKEPSLEYAMDKIEYSSDNSTWLDYLEPVFLSNDHHMASKANDIAAENESGQKEAVQDEVSLQDGTESSRQVHSLCRVETAGSLGNSTWLDYLEPGSLSDNSDMASKDNNLSAFQDSGRKYAVQNDIFLQNELPQKEETSTCGENWRGEGEISSSAVGYEPDGLDFDGLGDLFNEPEIADIPNLKPPSSSDTNIQSNEIAETGFLVGNCSESDPDEVDNSDSPVSIESCLAVFIKPELLSNEHGWHCENCSKALQEQGMQSRRRQQRAISKIQTSEVQDRIQSAPSSFDKGIALALVSSDALIMEIPEKHVLSTFDESLVSPNEKIDASQNYSNETSQKSELKEGNGEMNEALEELLQTSSCYKTCTQASISGEASDACSVNEPSNAECDTDEVQQRKSKLLPKGSDLEGNDSEKLNSDSMKVKRDATKRILINRVPPILTIHLKRFSQDARGRLSKLNGHVDFRDTIDLRPYMDPRCTGTDEYKFRLTGVVEHLGTMRGGHYVSYVRGTKAAGRLSKKMEILCGVMPVMIMCAKLLWKKFIDDVQVDEYSTMSGEVASQVQRHFKYCSDIISLFYSI
ncbi:ubiquitin-specific protease 2 [Actinidia rufa]|uniref:ubiquitinyl hydrolase 1 n=1 Tax=Actinidia rufa TaxID=165716 RepID=A0A7J0E8A5_9ERIC|nr:ubiquitin-specific protease 2 [Actinidia rufa]